MYLITRYSQKHTLKIIQVYIPNTKHADEVVDTFLDDSATVLSDAPVKFIILYGDFKAKFSINAVDIEGPLQSLDSTIRNDRGETLLRYLLQQSFNNTMSFLYKKWIEGGLVNVQSATQEKR